MTALIDETFELMRDKMSGHDGSHDFAHVERVVHMARFLMQHEGIVDPDEIEKIELAALLHDYGDHKYSTHPNAAKDWLNEKGYAHSEEVQSIIDGVSYSKN